MSNLSIRTNALRSAANSIAAAAQSFAEYEAKSPPDEIDGEAITIRTALRQASTAAAALLGRREREKEERSRRFAAVPVLQALLRFRDGSTRRVAVSKPTADIEEPHVGEKFYAALQSQGVVASLEAYPVLVVDRRRRVIAEIPSAT